jgi:hypothetical protein
MMATSEKATQNGADSPFLKIYRLSRIEREPTSGLEPLTCSSYE